ncbi:MAG TPA: prolyl oligopeptidase family serine peptidase [Candidatus Dormibacteraeota bacterium]|nr:prolyl oligopeptidase family serine peptidase [Candidatus Dormibacteraeota bacterium]
MRINTSLILLISVLLSIVAAARALQETGSPSPSPSSASGQQPKTRTADVKAVLHGVEITDPYRWLEDQKSSETRAWIDEQNTHTDALLTKQPGREELKQQVKALIEIDSMGPPRVGNDRYFFFKRQALQDQAMLYLRKGLEGKDELLIDPLAMSPDHTVTVNLNSISRDGTLLVYSVRHGGADEITPRLFDVDSRADLPDRFPEARYFGVSVLPDKSGLYFTRLTADGPRVYFHKIGVEPSTDVEVFGKGYGSEKIISCSVSEDGHYLVVTVLHGSAADRSELYVQDLARKGPIVPIVNDVPAAFFGAIADDRMFLRTNWKAPKWRIMEVNLKEPARDKWREVVPATKAVIEDLSLVGGKLAVHTTENVIPRLKLFEPSGKFVREVIPPAIGTISGLLGRWGSTEAFYSTSSFHVPVTNYRFDVATGKQTVWSQSKVPVEAEKYEVKQVWYTSKDGTKIPMFLGHAKGLKLDGSNPVFLTGYGGFNVTRTPDYNPLAAAWMVRGGVYAVANLRGGGEFGEEWHHAGMLDKKQNVFDDFIGAAEWLIQNHYTEPSRLAIGGSSNGGLLVGAALTQRPDLFGAVLCGYPLLDMVRYHKFLVAKYWVPEYGSSDDPEQFKYIYAYSPYHRVRPGTKYPAVLLISGDSDTRVDPLHARKMTALLQAATASGRPVLLHYDTKAGHSGGTPVSKQIENLTDELTFLFWQLDRQP